MRMHKFMRRLKIRKAVVIVLKGSTAPSILSIAYYYVCVLLFYMQASK